MSRSRWLTVLGATGAAFGAAGDQLQFLNQKLAVVFVIVGILLTTFNERAHGGRSRGQGRRRASRLK